MILVPLKFEAIALVVVQATLARAGRLNNAKSKIVGKMTSETRYRESNVGNLLQCLPSTLLRVRLWSLTRHAMCDGHVADGMSNHSITSWTVWSFVQVNSTLLGRVNWVFSSCSTC